MVLVAEGGDGDVAQLLGLSLLGGLGFGVSNVSAYETDSSD
jgi:hypothetical protein